MGDIGLIQRVLENLVRNAIQFTPEGGEVTISIAERRDSFAIAVSDRGPRQANVEAKRSADFLDQTERHPTIESVCKRRIPWKSQASALGHKQTFSIISGERLLSGA